MMLPDVKELLLYWQDHPPEHVILAAVHRIKRTRTGAGALPATRISPSKLPEDNAEPAAVAATADVGGNGLLAALARKGGGGISMEKLIGGVPATGHNPIG